MNEGTGARTPVLDSFGAGINAAVIGASGGIGRAFIDALDSPSAVKSVARLSRSRGGTSSNDPQSIHIDLEDERSIEQAAKSLKDDRGELHIIVVASGVLHEGDTLQPEKSWRHISPEAMERAFRINATGPALVAKHFLPLLAKDRKSVFAALSARVGSIEDNRFGGWHAYRASKAALNMIIRTLSIELSRRNPAAICVALHPGTVDTDLSKPFQANIPNGQLFSADHSVQCLLNVLEGLCPDDTGKLFAWDGQQIPF